MITEDKKKWLIDNKIFSEDELKDKNPGFIDTIYAEKNPSEDNLETSAKNALIDDEKGEDGSLGKIVTKEAKDAQDRKENHQSASNIGFQDMKVELLPSKGLFYDESLRIKFRSADNREIKHYSSMDENNIFDVNEHIYEILSKCMRITTNKGVVTSDYLSQFDKLYMFFSIRDLTMKKKNRQKKLNHSRICNKCGERREKEIDHNSFGFHNIDEDMMKFYDTTERCFIFKDDALYNGAIKVYVPTVGTENYIQKHIADKSRNKQTGQDGYYNTQYLSFIEWMVEDHRLLNDKYIKERYGEFENRWSDDQHYLMVDIVSKLAKGVKPTVDLSCDKNESCDPILKHSPITFQEGFRSLFNFSNLSARFFGDRR